MHYGGKWWQLWSHMAEHFLNNVNQAVQSTRAMLPPSLFYYFLYRGRADSIVNE